MDKAQAEHTIQTLLTTIKETQKTLEAEEIDWKQVADQFEDLSDTASELMFKVEDYIEEQGLTRVSKH